MERIAVEVDSKLKRDFEKTLINRYGHVGGRISPTIRELVRRWIKEEKKNGSNGGS